MNHEGLDILNVAEFIEICQTVLRKFFTRKRCGNKITGIGYQDDGIREMMIWDMESGHFGQ